MYIHYHVMDTKINSRKRRKISTDILFKEVEEYRRQEDGKKNVYLDNQIIGIGHPGQCANVCSFRCLERSTSALVFFCPVHRRIHRCGCECKEKILSRESYTCPLTGEVIDTCIISEEIRSGYAHSHENDPRFSGDGYIEKMSQKKMRIEEGMKNAVKLCSDAINEAGSSEELFIKACTAYFSRLCKKTDDFCRGGITMRVVQQFGLACAYMHREGLKVDDVSLFDHSEAFQKKLPKTYALTSQGLKVRSITRIQDLTRKMVREDRVRQDYSPKDLSTWIFPNFILNKA